MCPLSFNIPISCSPATSTKQTMPSYPQPANKRKFATVFNDPHKELTAPDTVNTSPTKPKRPRIQKFAFTKKPIPARPIIPIEEEITPDGLYEGFAQKMLENQKLADDLWEKRDRLLLATIYGCKYLGAFKRGKYQLDEEISKHIKAMIWEVKGVEWRKMPPQLEMQQAIPYRVGSELAPPPVWQLIMLPEEVTNEEFLKLKNCIRMNRKGMAIILAPFPWELNMTQHFKMLHIPKELREREIKKVVMERIGSRITEKIKLTQCTDHKGRVIWNMTLAFDLTIDEGPGSKDGPDFVIDTLGLHERKWLVQGREWVIRNGDHCEGCHGRGHVIKDCQFFTFLHPLDYHPNTPKSSHNPSQSN